MNWLRRLGRFFYDFLVGDAWELFIGTLVILAVAWLLVQAGFATAIVGGLLFLGVLAVAGLSLLLALRTAA